MNIVQRVFLAALPLALATGSAAIAAPDPQAAALIKASGRALGISALRSIKVLQEDADVVAGGLPGTGTQWLEIDGNRFAERNANPPLIGADGYDGKVVWGGDGSGLVVNDGSDAGMSQEIDQAYLADYVLFRPGAGGASVHLAPRQNDKGEAFDVLSIDVPHSKLPVSLWLDAKTHLPARVVIVTGPIISTTYLSDYRPTHGLMIARKQHQESSDGNSADTKITRVAINPSDGAAHLQRPPSTVHDFSIANGASQTSVPFDLVENHVYLTVMLNGKGPYHFIYDTGGANVVDPAVAAEIGTAAKGSVQGGGVGSATESVSFANVDTMNIGDATVKNQLFAVAPVRQGFGVSGGRPVDGLIGFEVLARFVTTFDYEHHRVFFTMPSSASVPAGAQVLPFVLAGHQPQFACTLNGVPSECALDTGARDSLTLFTPFVAAHPQVVAPVLSANGVGGFGFGGPAFGKLGRLQSVGIGSFELKDIVAEYSTQTQGAFAAPFIGANVGGNLLRRFNLWLDYGKQTMALVPNNAFGERDAYERAGLFLINKGGAKTVYDARPGTAAAQAGIVKGDVIASIDGVDTATMTLQAVRERFFEPAGTQLHLGVVGADGKHRTVTLTLRDFI